MENIVKDNKQNIKILVTDKENLVCLDLHTICVKEDERRNEEMYRSGYILEDDYK